MLKVAYILSRFPDLTETFIMREMYWLHESGVEVDIFALLPQQPAPIHQQAEELMPRVHYSPYVLSWNLICAHFYYVFRSPLRYLRALWRAVELTWREPSILFRVLALYGKIVYFARQMEGMGIEHIHAHFVWINGIAAAIVSDLTGTTFSLHPHAFGLFMRDQQDVRRQLEGADLVVTVSEFHRAYIADLCDGIECGDVEIVHYGLETDRFQLPEQADVRRIPHILSVGSLIEKKGHEYLIDACAILAHRGYEFRCSIIGRGPLQELLQARINANGLADEVQLVGGIRQQKVIGFYHQSDIFALPCTIAQSGDRDGMPNVLIEAMAMQIPVITTSVTGIPELVHDRENGLLVPDRDATVLAQALELLLRDESLRAELGKRGRETVLRGFDIRRTTAHLAKLFGRTTTKGAT
jgi:colanic acid/amylovoran biosynthesis glycosyltransferase